MRPSDLYAMPTLGEDDWRSSPAVAIMFGEEHAYPEQVSRDEVPLDILTKARAVGPDEDGEGDALWQVIAWEGRPFGTVQRVGIDGWRVVTDADLFGQASADLASVSARRMGKEEVAADAFVQGLDLVGGHRLMRSGDGFRPVEARLCAGSAAVLDPATLAGLLPDPGATLAKAFDALGTEGLREALLASMPPGLRVAFEYDVGKAERFPTPRSPGWAGPLVATDEGTYLLGIWHGDAHCPVADAVRVLFVGDPSLVDTLATGPVVVTGTPRSLP